MSELTPWQKYKANLGKSRPWDIVNPNIEQVDDEVRNKRLSLCLGCEHLIKLTTQCKKCGCFMASKTKLANADCPVGKW